MLEALGVTMWAGYREQVVIWRVGDEIAESV